MTTNKTLKDAILQLSDQLGIPANTVDELIYSISNSNLKIEDAEKLISELDDNKKSILLEVYKTVR